MLQTKRILITPLNWGLGHATRCIPIIEELLNRGAEVIIASDGRALQLLKVEFPQLAAFELPAYDIQYPTQNMVWNMAWQLPNILKAIWQEKKAIQKIVDEQQVDAIISDNRYGCLSSKTKNIFLTHQLNIKIPLPIFSRIVNYCNHLLIQKFNECWVPDFEEEPNISGDLGHGGSFKNVNYVGALSRMKHFEIEKRYDVIVVLSGPEPQRTFLEEIIIQQAQNLPLHFLIVQGKTETDKELNVFENIEMVSFLTSKDLNKAILSSQIVLCRSGYSSLMDLAKLGKPAILVPTPGQTEQEYLAERFFVNKVFYFQHQNDFDLKSALEKVQSFKGFHQRMEDSENHLTVSIQNLLENI